MNNREKRLRKIRMARNLLNQVAFDEIGDPSLAVSEVTQLVDSVNTLDKIIDGMDVEIDIDNYGYGSGGLEY